MSDVSGMRKKLHELVEKGEILEAIKEAGQTHGFHTKIISEPGTVSDTERSDENTVFIEPCSLYELEDIARKDVKLVEKYIEYAISRRAGRNFRPRQPVKVNEKKVPYSSSDIKKRQEEIGGDADSARAASQRNSQANLYATAKTNGPKETIAMDIWRNSIYAEYYELDRDEPSAFAGLPVSVEEHKRRKEELRQFNIEIMAESYAKLAGYSYWLKPLVLGEIVNKVADIDRRCRTPLVYVLTKDDWHTTDMQSGRPNADGNKTQSEMDKGYHAIDKRKPRSGK